MVGWSDGRKIKTFLTKIGMKLLVWVNPHWIEEALRILTNFQTKIKLWIQTEISIQKMIDYMN